MNPYVELKKASKGSVESYRALAREACEIGVGDGSLFALAEALIFARLAYAASNDPADAGSLLSILGLASDAVQDVDCVLQAELMGEGIALTSKLADEGDPFADGHLSEVVRSASKDAVRLSHGIFEMMNEEPA